MVQIWRDWIKDTFGTLERINHRSGRDDPPDLELIFEGGRVVGMEHTKLLPKHVGEAEAWLRKSGRGGGLPSISSPPANKDELRDIVAGVKPAWSSVIDDWKTISNLLAVTLRKKMDGTADGSIIGIVCDLFAADGHEHLLAKIANDIVNTAEFEDFTNYTLILLNRSTLSKFYSALIRRARILEQAGDAPPLSRDGEELLSEIIALEAESNAAEPL